MMLTNKVAVIYGAGGAIGSAVARAFAREGATLFLTGRQQAPVEALARDLASDGDAAAKGVEAVEAVEAAEVDALDERAVENHLESVIAKAGRIDISFNAIGIPDANILGVPLIDLDLEQFTLPIAAYTTSYFLTARLAARRMIANKSGVIMTVTALHSRTGIPLVGGYGPAMAAKEALTRDLSAELAPHGIRVVGLRPQAMPETRTIEEAFEARAENVGHHVGTVAAGARQPHSRPPAHDARGDGQRRGLHRFRSRERPDRHHRQLDPGLPRRLTSSLEPGSTHNEDTVHTAVVVFGGDERGNASDFEQCRAHVCLQLR